MVQPNHKYNKNYSAIAKFVVVLLLSGLFFDQVQS